MTLSELPLPVSVCLWVIAVVVCAFSVVVLVVLGRFALFVWRSTLVSPSVSPVRGFDGELRCVDPTCPGELGPIISAVSTDDGAYDRRQCVKCKRPHLLKRNET